MKRALLLVGLAALGAFLGGCKDGSYGSADLSAQQGDMSASLNLNSAVQMNEGSASSIEVNLKAKDGDVFSGTVQSSDPTILQIATTPADTNRYVFLGVKAGATQVTIQGKGKTVASIPATVLAPPAFTLPDAGATPVVNDGGSD
jgi:hypothetical protein